MRRERLDKLLVERGLVQSRERARALILAGKVVVEDHAVDKAGTRFPVDARLRLKGEDLPYVSRGGLKLEKGLEAFGVKVSGRAALDVGASTGGFTDCLLQRGAARVYAVDVGYGQLAWKLRNDPRVVNLERTNIRDLGAGRLDQSPDLAVIDASFISLEKVLPNTLSLLADGAEVVALVKPQFEVGKGKVGKGGVVRDEEQHREVLEKVREAACALGCEVLGTTDSPILGPKGNREFLVHLRKGTAGEGGELPAGEPASGSRS
ncbi:TlyA family RNA methyltransferase [uncultured Desulfuromonas sp.]|uniref:TlyA family RNA methyltransferase n=1 Tax=uncultured Desulfuromonas sp. TaxID=181013 RepID=UPI002625A95F|nr:TlyA family RNA methyltransferase [uncultured Desulfuromonas sp.]